MHEINSPRNHSNPDSPSSLDEYRKAPDRKLKLYDKLPSPRELQRLSYDEEEDDEEENFAVPQKRLVSISELNPIFEELDYSSTASSTTEEVVELYRKESGLLKKTQKSLDINCHKEKKSSSKSSVKCKRTSSFRQIWSSLGSTTLPGLPVASGAKSQESFTSSSSHSDASKVNDKKTIKNRLKKISSTVRKQFSTSGGFIADRLNNNGTAYKKESTFEPNNQQVEIENGSGDHAITPPIKKIPSEWENKPKISNSAALSFSHNDVKKVLVPTESEDIIKPIVQLECFKRNIYEVKEMGLEWNLPNWTGASTRVNGVGILEDVIEEEKRRMAQTQPMEWAEAVDYLRRSVGRDFRRGYLALGEKMQLPNLQAVRCLKFSPFHSFLAIGCEEGTLLLLELDFHKPLHHLESQMVEESLPESSNNRGGATCRVRMNATLVGHAYDLRCLNWNTADGKLITSDEIGVIIGWSFNDDACWVEEIINDRSTSLIRDMAWSPDGKKIVIGYEDFGENGFITGGIVVAFADGSQIYDRKFPESQVNFVVWYDDSVVWAVVNHVLYAFDEIGELGKVYRPLAMSHSGERVEIVSFLLKPKSSWVTSERAPDFVVIYKNSCMGLHCSINDKSPVKVHTQINATCADWSSNGLYIVVGGLSITTTGAVASPQVNLFNYEGKLLQILKVPEKIVTSVSWDPESFHLAISTERHIYFANLRPMYKVSSSQNTHCYAYTKDCVNQLITFWNFPSTLFAEKLPGKVIDIKSCNQKFAVLLMDSLGVYHVLVFGETGVHEKHLCIITMEPFILSMTKNCIICLAPNAILNWNYNLGGSNEKDKKFTGALRTTRQVHIDDFPAIIAKPGEKGEHLNKPVLDCARCMHAVRDQLCVAKESGKLQLYALPTLGFLQTFLLDLNGDICQQIRFNNDGTRLALLTMNGRLRICVFPQITGQQMEIIFCEGLASGISGMLWASDLQNFICVMEGDNVHILQDGQILETIANMPAGCYMAGFEDLKISLIQMDRVIENPDNPTPDMIIKLPTPSYSKILDALEQEESLDDIISILNSLPYCHPILNKTIGNEALRQGDYAVAESIFTEDKNYTGLRFIQGLNELQEPDLKQAYTYGFLGDYDRAQHFFIRDGRKDLAIKMWKDLGQWEKVTFLSGHNTEDFTKEALESQYEVCSFTHDWDLAFTLANKMENVDKMIQSCIMLEDYEALTSLAERLPIADPMLDKIGKILGCDGLVEDSVQCFMKNGDAVSAMKVAMDSRKWDMAMKLSVIHGLPYIQPALVKHVRSLISDNRLNPAIQVLDRCGKVITAGKLLVWKGLKLLGVNTEDLMEVKKVFILAARMFSKKNRIKKGEFPYSSSEVEELDLEFLIPETQLRMLSGHNEWCWCDAWRGAEALHFLILTQRFIYNGMIGRAFKAAMHLRNFEDILGSERVNSLVALTAINNSYYSVASNALLKLETEDERYSSISFNLFREHAPRDLDVTRIQCSECQRNIPDFYSSCPYCNAKFNICIFSASQINKDKERWTCQICLRSVELSKRDRFGFCVLCHSRAD